MGSERVGRALIELTFIEHPLDVATVAAWRALAARVTCNGPSPIKFTVEGACIVPGGKLVPARLHAAMTTCLADGTSIPEESYELRTHIDIRRLGPPSLTTFYRLARMLYMHELMEWFRVDGQVHEDPHPGWAYTLDHPDGVSVREAHKR